MDFVKIMTLNIWNYAPHWGERRNQIAELIVAHQPDAVCLQETRHDFRYQRGTGQGEQLAVTTGYHATSAISQVYVPVLRVDEGLTILSLHPPLRSSVRRLTLHPHLRHDENRRICLGVIVDHEGAEVAVYTTHFSLDPAARLTNAAETARFVLETAGPRPAILTGDLNAEPGSAPVRLLRGEPFRFLDCWEAVRPADVGYTYASYHPVRRIDYILARGPASVAGIELVGGAADQGVYPSDHLGILVDIVLDETGRSAGGRISGSGSDLLS